MNKLAINVLLALVIIIPLIFFFYPPDPNFSIPEEELGAASVIDSTKTEKIADKETEISESETSAQADSLSSFVNVTDSISSTNLTLASNESFAIKEPEEIQIPLSEEVEIPVPDTTVASNGEKDTLAAEVAPFEAGRVAVIPFCNGTDDLDFAKKLHMDASYAIRTSNTGNFTSVSKNSVNGAIQRLGYRSDNLCSEVEAIKVAQSLQVESIVVGNIIQLPDNQYRIICEVLHIPSRQYSREITLTDSDLDRLRRNLKREIQQIFN